MNNRGFAVSAALYGMVVLFVVVMFGLLNMFKDYRSINKDYVNNVKEYLNSVEANIEEPIITAKTLDSQDNLDLEWYPYLLKLTITINNPNSQAVNRKIQLKTPLEIAISSSAYVSAIDTIKIKSCNTAFTFGSATAISICTGNEYNLTYDTGNEPHTDLDIAENNGALPFTNNEYFLIGTIALEPNNNTFIFYLRTTADYQAYYDNIETDDSLITLTY